MQWASSIIHAFLEADSLRISDAVRALEGGSKAVERAIHRPALQFFLEIRYGPPEPVRT